MQNSVYSGANKISLVPDDMTIVPEVNKAYSIKLILNAAYALRFYLIEI